MLGSYFRIPWIDIAVISALMLTIHCFEYVLIHGMKWRSQQDIQNIRKIGKNSEVSRIFKTFERLAKIVKLAGYSKHSKDWQK